MRFSKTAFSLATAALVVSGSVAFAQTATDVGNDRGGAATTRTTPSTAGATSMGRSDSMSAHSMNKMGGTDAGAGTTKNTATGGPSGGNPTKN